MSDDKITELPVKRRKETGKLMLIPKRDGCIHFPASFEIDVNGNKCKCKLCGGEVSPWFVLEKLMQNESRWNQTREAYNEEMKRLKERSSTKCGHCGKMTPISRR